MRPKQSIEVDLPPFPLLADDGGGDPGGGGGEDGSGDPTPADWSGMVAALPKDLRESVPDLQTSKDFPSFVTQYREQGKLIGTNRLPTLTKDSKLPAVYDFFKALGRPDKSTEYDLGNDFGPPENLPWDEESLPELLDVMHRAGLNNDQVKAIARGYVESAGRHFERLTGVANEAYEDLERGLRREWGNQYDENADLAHRAYKHVAGDQFQDAESLRLENGTAAMDHPVITRILAMAGQAMREHGLLGEAAGPLGGATPAVIRSKIAALQAEDRMNDSNHPQHAEALREWNSLIEQLGDEPLDPSQEDFL
jgi:hypothetical protein